MTLRDTVRTVTAAVMLMGTLLVAPAGIPAAAAEPCPDTEVVFARGSGQPVGLGDVGEAFVASLTEQLPGRDVAVYPVDYPASTDYRNSALLGESDATARIQATVANCPNTKLVLGGYSQGASVIEMSSNSLPPAVAQHVAAVALFGPPSSPYSTSLWGGPLPVLAASYHPKTINFCLAGDIYCEDHGSVVPHLMYVQDGKADEGAAFVANRLTSG
ncbi:cutinase family protein [Mycolicibacter senuensis]|uniref:Cutinase n=1 Tax=Mycolicibacter senuensis TaxID=386913 RepID=A0A7I9XJR5_9MYCO|nr:cutinase family protein [Mycolicibacter senuensis]MDQ2625979.1 cutinase family protein [Actinomycetota bacterium]ORW67658.1 cutinase [Mycolicibacter senuensis]GFG69968.1 putative cutinase [Mycolicibacter senuensis]